MHNNVHRTQHVYFIAIIINNGTHHTLGVNLLDDKNKSVKQLCGVRPPPGRGSIIVLAVISNLPALDFSPEDALKDAFVTCVPDSMKLTLPLYHTLLETQQIYRLPFHIFLHRNSLLYTCISHVLTK